MAQFTDNARLGVSILEDPQPRRQVAARKNLNDLHSYA
jgi:hypothetical protein